MICFDSIIIFIPACSSSFTGELNFHGLGFELIPTHFSIREFTILIRIIIHLFCLVLPHFRFVVISISVLMMLFDYLFAIFPERNWNYEPQLYSFSRILVSESICLVSNSNSTFPKCQPFPEGQKSYPWLAHNCLLTSSNSP